ncbi:hypothetical protein BBJ28_00018896 [Nothophytophthora sp. Chile5]|nr:hypothetical protein BBJ28_00018896 [Nothophytophthora sp. Chile5]
MKFSTVLVALAAAVVCLTNPVASESEAVHLRVHVSETDKGVCYMSCPSGAYCANGTNKCVKPKGKTCFNPSTGAFQTGCSPGFACKNGKCDYA